MAAMVRHHIESAGFQVLTAGDVDTAWDLLVGERPEAAIVDIQLPGKEGWDLLSRSRVDERTRHLPLVVLTALQGAEIRNKVEAFGADYFTKPFAASALVKRLRELVIEEEEVLSEALPVLDVVDTIEDLSGSAPQDASVVDEERSEMVERILGLAPPPPPTIEQPQEVASAADLGLVIPAGMPIDLVAVKVMILLDHYQIEGLIHMPSDLGRFSDSWESMFDSPRSFVPVTDARVTLASTGAVASTPFLQVKKSDIRSIFPLDQ